MKPLTLEELKSLEVGDWVWLIYKDTDYRRYAQIQAIEGTRLYVWGRGFSECEMLKYFDYGTKWIAFKNKEQAESKGEIVELPCKVGDTVCIFRKGYDFENSKKIEISEYTVKRIELNSKGTLLVLNNRAHIYLKDYMIESLLEDYIVFGGLYFCTKKEAENHLAELRGE